MLGRDIDRGRAWVVLIGCFVNQCVIGGYMYSIGLVLLVLAQSFPDQIVIASFASSFMSSLMHFIGPISGMIADLMTCRAAMMLGGISSCLGFFISAFADDLRILFFSYGVLVALMIDSQLRKTLIILQIIKILSILHILTMKWRVALTMTIGLNKGGKYRSNMDIWLIDGFHTVYRQPASMDISSGSMPVTDHTFTAFGFSVAYVPSTTLIGLNFVRHRDRVNSFNMSGVGWGVLIVATIINLSSQAYGWRGMFLIQAGVSLQSVVFSCLCRPSSLERLYKRDKSVSKSRSFTRKNPSKSALDITHDKDKFSPNNSCDNQLTNATESLCSRMRSLMTKSFLFLNIDMFANSVANSLPMMYIPLYAVECGVPNIFSTWLIIILGVCLVVTRTVMGSVLNRFGRIYLWYIVLCLVWSVASFTYPLISSYDRSHIIFAVIYGLTAAPLPVFLTMLTIQLVGPKNLTLAFGVEMMSCGFGFLVGPALAGLVIESTKSHGGVFFVSGGALLVTAASQALSHYVFPASGDQPEAVVVESLNSVNLVRSSVSLTGMLGATSFLRLDVIDYNGDVVPWNEVDMSPIVHSRQDLRLSIRSLFASKLTLSSRPGSQLNDSIVFGSQCIVNSLLGSSSNFSSINDGLWKTSEHALSTSRYKNVSLEISPLAMEPQCGADDDLGDGTSEENSALVPREMDTVPEDSLLHATCKSDSQLIVDDAFSESSALVTTHDDPSLRDFVSVDIEVAGINKNMLLEGTSVDYKSWDATDFPISCSKSENQDICAYENGTCESAVQNIVGRMHKFHGPMALVIDGPAEINAIMFGTLLNEGGISDSIHGSHSNDVALLSNENDSAPSANGSYDDHIGLCPALVLNEDAPILKEDDTRDSAADDHEYDVQKHACLLFKDSASIFGGSDSGDSGRGSYGNGLDEDSSLVCQSRVPTFNGDKSGDFGRDGYGKVIDGTSTILFADQPTYDAADLYEIVAYKGDTFVGGSQQTIAVV